MISGRYMISLFLTSISIWKDFVNSYTITFGSYCGNYSAVYEIYPDLKRLFADNAFGGYHVTSWVSNVECCNTALRVFYILQGWYITK